MIGLFNQLSQQCSKLTTERYSTSFASAVKLLHPDIRPHIHNIYGFVRFADEIVDTFHAYDKAALLEEFKRETYLALDRGISLNPILHSFQATVKYFNINRQLVNDFLRSMELDLEKKYYTKTEYDAYIYGSAEVVGLMCLHVFCEGNETLYEHLTPAARSLGAAFQKVNFLRDIKADYQQLNRVYFPGCDFKNFTAEDKTKVEQDIQQDLSDAYQGIVQLPAKARFGVYVAYKYYLSLFRKIQKIPSRNILQERVRIPNYGKAFIVAKAGLQLRLNLL